MTVPSANPLPTIAFETRKETAERRHGKDRETLWKEFTRRYGSDLEPRYSTDGRLASLRGTGTPARSFQATSEGAEKRALEVLAAASALLGIEDALPLSNPKSVVTPNSGQVHFQESYEGSPIAPYGTVSVRLGAQGELLGIDSMYVPGVRPSNRRPSSPGPGSLVVWLSSPTPGSGARWAYETRENGQQIVRDAETGAVLFRRDRRQM